jgi:glycosyltransferase involved in cell wall biosynthesis
MFSILIPTWNNLPLLKLCVESIRQNSVCAHQIVLHINEGVDGTLEWAKEEGLDFTVSAQNLGVCKAVNLAFGKAVHQYIMYINDDMYVLPDWDRSLIREIDKTVSDLGLFMFSATMIEPEDRNNPCALVADYGRGVDDFQKERLLSEYRGLEKTDWSGSSWPPLVVHRDAWLLVGGFSVEFSPGMYSDPDFSMKMWMIGCRVFKGVGDSKVYHFQASSTGRVVKNNGRLQFMKKWGLPASYFYKEYLQLGKPYLGVKLEPAKSLVWKLQRLKARALLVVRIGYWSSVIGYWF